MKHYLYRHIRKDKNQPFYIGIGTKPKKYNCRIKEYSRAYDRRRNRIHNNISDKTNYIVEIIVESDDYDFIKNKEREFIKLYGRIDLKTGCLANMTDGGEGIKGLVHTEEARRKISNKKLGTKLSKEHREKLMEGRDRVNSKPILQYSLKGIFIKEWKSAKDAALELNLNHSSILNCAREIYDYAGYFLWKFKESAIIPQTIKVSDKMLKFSNYVDTKNRLNSGINLNMSKIKLIDNNMTEYFNSIKECSEKINIRSFYICRLLKSGKLYKNRFKVEYQ